MLYNEDEERKKRLEEARNIISNNSLNDNIKYDTKIQEANSIINSINPPKVKEITEEQKIESINNANDFINFIDQNSKNIIEEDVKKEEPTKNNTITKNNNQNRKENQNSINTNSIVKEENNFRNVHGTAIQNNDIKSDFKEESKNMVEMNNYDIKAQNEADKRNEQIKKGGVEGFNATVETVLKNIQGGIMSAAAALGNVATTAVAFGARGLESWAYVLGKEDTAKKLNDFYNKTVDTGEELSNKAGYESNVTSRIENEGVKTAGMVTNVVSEMATNAAIGYVLPGGSTGKLGTTIQGLGVGGRSAQEVLNENKDNIKQATITGIAKGFTSYLTEKMFDANILTKGDPSSISDKVDDLIFNNIKSKFGAKFASKTVGIIGENVEELAEDNIGNVIDYIVNDKDFPTIKDWWDNTSETAKVTTISTIVMSMLGLGGADFENKQQNYLTRKVEKYIDDNSLSIQYGNILNQESNNNQFYITNFNQDGNIENIQTVKGKEIINPNKKVNVNPVIVNNNGNYNVIDSNTGLLLDNAPYRTIIEAESRFNNKMINLDNATINNINNRVTQANVVIGNKIQEITNSVQSELNAQETVQSNQNVEPITQTPLKNVEDTLKNGQENVNKVSNIDIENDIAVQTPSQIAQNNDTDNSNQYMTNYTSNSNEQITNQNNVLQEIQETVSKISDNTIYSTEKTSKVFRTVANNIPTIELQISENGASLNSLNENGEVVYSQKLSGKPYSGQRIKQIINNAISNADLSNVNTSQTSQNEFRAVSNSEVINFNIKQNTSSKINYKNATELIKGEQEKAEQNFNTDINIRKIDELDNINFNKISQNEYIKLSKNIYKNYVNRRIFKNNNSDINIKAVLEDIKESSYKAYNSKFQNKFLKEHIEALSQLDKIISNGNESSINSETKNRVQYKGWRYFTTQVLIENRPFLIEFDVTEKNDGFHFRLQRLIELDVKNKRATTSAMTKISRC